MRTYFISDSNLTENECKIMCAGLEKFKEGINGILKSKDCDKITRKNALSKIDLINSAKNRIDHHINDIPYPELIAIYCGLDQLDLKDDPDCDSAKEKLKILFDAADIDIEAIVNPLDACSDDSLPDNPQ